MEVPVFLSSLLQLPFISSMLGSNQKVGILCAHEETFDRALLTGIGVDSRLPMVIRGMDRWKYFYQGIMIESGELDADRIEAEMVAAASQMVEEDPSVGAILLECADLPPYAEAVQKSVNLPVFDFVTMINYVYSAVVQKKYDGFM